MFIDWVTVTQHHCKPHTPFHGEVRITLNPDYTRILKSIKFKRKIQGSDGTSISIHSDGHTVKLDGNAGLLNRTDNLFGYPLEQIMFKINSLLATPEINLPPFTQGETYFDKDEKLISSGAKFIRLDLTENYNFGSFKKAQKYHSQLKQIKINNKSLRVYENTVYYGKSDFMKVYIPSVLLQKRINKISRLAQTTQSSIDYLQRLLAFEHSNGALRVEVQYRDYLLKNGLAYWADLTHEKLFNHFEAEKMQLPKSCEHVKTEELTPAVAKTLLMHMSGVNVKDNLERRTYYRHRKALLEYQVDINNPIPKEELLNFMQFHIDVEFKPLQKPDWYDLPEIKQA